MLNKVKTNALTGAALDWAVAKCEKLIVVVQSGACHDADLIEMDVDGDTRLIYSTDWSQGGPIIEREGIEVSPEIECIRWYGSVNGFFLDGPTPLIAAMRCYVASKLGDTVEIPKELTPC